MMIVVVVEKKDELETKKKNSSSLFFSFPFLWIKVRHILLLISTLPQTRLRNTRQYITIMLNQDPTL